MYLRYLNGMVLSLFLLAGIAWSAEEAGGVRPETTALYQKARDQVAKLENSPAAKYAPEFIRLASESVELAQNGLKAGNDTATRQSSELAMVQARLALATADERIAAEKTAATQAELQRLEQRLADILAGKGEKP